MRTFSLILSLCIFYHVSACGMPGSYCKQDANGAMVQQMAMFAVGQYAAKTNAVNDGDVKVVQAATQVVAGLNYKLKVETSYDGQKMVCDFVVFDQSWTSTRELTSDSCHADHSNHKKVGGLAGGMSHANLNSDDFKNAMNFCAEQVNMQSNSMFKSSPTHFSNCKQQVVAGMRYVCDVTFSETDCMQSDNHLLSDCAVKSTGMTVKYQCDVVSQPWMTDKFTLLHLNHLNLDKVQETNNAKEQDGTILGIPGKNLKPQFNAELRKVLKEKGIKASGNNWIKVGDSVFGRDDQGSLFSLFQISKNILGRDGHGLKPHGKSTLLGRDGHDMQTHGKAALLGRDGHDTLLGRDGHDLKPHGKSNLLGRDGHDMQTHGKSTLLGGDGHDMQTHGKSTLLGGDGHDMQTHGKTALLGRDGHDMKPHGKSTLLGGDGHDTQTHGKAAILGRDGHDMKPHGKSTLLGGDGHDMQKHGKAALLGRDGHDMKPHGKSTLLGGDGHDMQTHGKAALLGRDGHDMKPHGKSNLGRDGHDVKSHGKSTLLGGDGHDMQPHSQNAVGRDALNILVHGQPLLGGDEFDLCRYNIFKQFQQHYKRLYSSRTEEKSRFKIFCDNMRKAMKLQQMEKGTARYGITKFADLSESEFKKYVGKVWDQDANKGMKKAAIPKLKTIPSNFDWREHNAVTEVKNQGSCGSCWAFSTTGNIEGQWAIKKGKLISLSEQELVDCDKVDEGCNGGLPSQAYKEIIRLGGLESEKDYKYDGVGEKCAFNKSEVRVKINGSVSISSNETEMAAWLVKNGPISIGINAFAMQFYMGGISHPWKIFCNPKSLDHGVLIVGFGVKNKTPYWIVKNSWGPDWGEKGYYLVYRGGGVCGLNTMCTSAVVN